jgi:hypothetical protein
MVANFREKRTSITTMGAKTQAFDIIPIPPYFSLPLTFKQMSPKKAITIKP